MDKPIGHLDRSIASCSSTSVFDIGVDQRIADLDPRRQQETSHGHEQEFSFVPRFSSGGGQTLTSSDVGPCKILPTYHHQQPANLVEILCQGGFRTLSRATQNLINENSRQRTPIKNLTMTESRQDKATASLSKAHGKTPRRVRSRAIAIKPPSNSRARQQQHRNDLEAEIHQPTSAEAMYDWATWRMYNRIIDHRQKHPLGTDYESQSPASTKSCSYVERPLHESLALVTNNTARYPETISVSFEDDSSEDGIFDLEM